MASIRAILPRTSLTALARTVGPDALAALEQRAPALFAQIHAAGPLDWLALDVDLELSALVAEQHGAHKDRERARSCLRAALDAPLLRPFVRGVETLFTLDPAAMLRQVPRGWPRLYRDAGSMRYEVGIAGRRLVVYEDVPARVMARPVYLAAIAGALESFFELCKVEGEIEIETVGDDRVHYHLSWW